MQNNPVLIEITRGDVAESTHRGAFMVANDQNELVAVVATSTIQFMPVRQ